MASEIRVNSLSSRTGLSTVTFTDTGPIFSGITTFQDNSGFNVGTGGSIFSPASNTVTLGTNNAERFRITSGGNIGINSTDPTSYANSQATLVIEDTISPALCISDTGQARDWFLIGQGDGLALNYADGGGSSSANNVTSSMFFRNNGNVGINESSPARPLSVTSSQISARFTSSSADSQIEIIDSSGTVVYGSASGNAIVQTGSAERVRITSTGNVGINTSTFAANGTNFKVSDGTISRLALDKTGANARKFEIGNFGTGLNVYDVTADEERLRITSGGELKIPAGIGPQITFENQHGHTGDAVISTYDDGVGTLLCLGSNFYFNSGGGETRYNTSEESAAIIINRTGNIDFNTGDTSATATARLRITADGETLISNSINRFLSLDRTNASSGSGEFNVNVEVNSQTSISYDDGAQIVIGTSSSPRTQAGFDEKVRITSDGHVTKVKQPGFFTRRAVGGDGRSGGAQEWSVSGTGSFNTGSHFNASNGRFTAPIAGRYLFTAAPGYKQTGQNYQFYFRINGVDSSEPVRFIDGGDDLTSHSLATGTVIYNLSANDYVDVYIGVTHHVNLTYNFFMGYLLG